MKKSKLLLASLLTCSLLLAGCNKKENPSSVPPASSQPPIEGDYTVTQAEFESAMSLRYKNLTYKGYEISGGVSSEQAHMKFLANGSSHQIKAGGWGNLAWRVQGDKVYQIAKYEETYYVKSVRTINGYENGNYGDDMGFIGYIDDVKDKYSELTYDATSHSYKGSILFTYPPETMDVEIKFENKKLVSYYMSQEYMGETFGMLVNVFDYGTTTIDFDSLNYVNDFFVAGRKFAFNHSESNLDPSEKIDFDEQNATSFIQFNTDGTFSMYVHHDYQTSGEKTYTGTYQFTILDSDTSLSFHFNDDGRDVMGNFDVSYNEYQQGAKVLVPVRMDSENDIFFSFDHPILIS